MLPTKILTAGKLLPCGVAHTWAHNDHIIAQLRLVRMFVMVMGELAW